MKSGSFSQWAFSNTSLFSPPLSTRNMTALWLWPFLRMNKEINWNEPRRNPLCYKISLLLSSNAANWLICQFKVFMKSILSAPRYSPVSLCCKQSGANQRFTKKGLTYKREYNGNRSNQISRDRAFSSVMSDIRYRRCNFYYSRRWLGLEKCIR